MIYRFMYAAYTKDPESMRLLPDIPHYAALAFDGERAFLYIESQNMEVAPETMVKGNFQLSPGGKIWERAVEIFHYSVPMNPQQWERKCEKTPYFQVNRLKPEKISSYIYYHYQYQEEYPGDGDRYGLIYLLGDQLIFYLENPTEKETEKYKGLLDTKHSPIDTWQEVMTEHFAEQWRPIPFLKASNYVNF